MKKRIITVPILILMMNVSMLWGGGLVDTLEQAAGQKLRMPGEKIFVGAVEKRQKELEAALQERDELTKKREELEPKIKTDLEEIKGQLDQIQKRLKTRPDDEYLKKKSTILTETSQVLKDLQRPQAQVIGLIDELVKALREFLDDPDFAVYKKEKVQERLFYSFDDLQKLHNQIRGQEKKLEHLSEQEKNAQAELENSKRAESATREAYKKRKDELAAAAKEDAGELTSEQTADILSLEERLFNYQIELHQSLEKEMEYKVALLSVQSFIMRSHKDILKDFIRKIKSSVRVSKADIADAQEKLKEESARYYKAKERYRQDLAQLAATQDKKEQARTILTKRYGVTLDADWDEWTKEPQKTVDSYLALCEVGATNSELLTLQTQKELLEAQSAQEDEKFNYERLQVEVKQSYHKITMRKSTEEIAQELKKYEARKAEAQAALAKYKENINTVADQLTTQKKILDTIHGHRQELEKLKNTIFKGRATEYARCIELLDKAETSIKEQIDILGKLTGVYSGITATSTNSSRLIGFIAGELEGITIWYRPEGAITWQGVKNVGTDVVTFFADVQSYITRFKIGTLFERIRNSFKEPFTILLFLFNLLVVIVGLFLFRRAFPSINAMLLRVGQESSGLMRLFSLLLSALLSFVYTYFVSVSIWLVLLSVFLFQVTPDPYIYILFYLASIPYLLYLINRFVRHMVQFNVRHDYVFLAPDFQRRFVVVFSVFLYASVSLFLFRQAFILGNYFGSELPDILLAVIIIIFQISLILLIIKEQILNFIPTETPFWQWVRTQVDAYYYLILLAAIAVIIMINPYVGYWKLVLYVLGGLIYTGLLLIGLFWLHGLFKRIASRVFFATSDEIVRERFANAKTWFGLLIISSFLIVGFLGFIIGARIWGWQITFDAIAGWIREPIPGTEASPITVLSLVRILGFVFMGFLAAYWLNRFVLAKIFDLLLIDAGVQHTVTSITQYIVIVTAFFIGFQSAGLGVIVNWLFGGLIFGLGWILKEPISDFISYFIILVQRPVKIGDYVKVDENTMGVVRRITARSVILRRKNSTTIIVPNSYLLGHTVMNWNYARNFIAFDDILLIIDYQEDPEQVKEILLSVVEAHPNVLKNPRPIVRLDQFGEYGFIFLIRGFLSSVYTLEQWNTASDIRFAVIKELRANNISVALPVRMLMNRLKDRGPLKEEQ